MSGKTNGETTALEIFKQRHGPASDELLGQVKELNKRKAVRKRTRGAAAD